MTTGQAIVDALHTLLVNNTAVAAAVSSRIYDSNAPQDPTLPMIVHSVASDTVQHYFSLDDLGPLEIQVDVFNKFESGVKATRAIGDTVYAALHRQTFTASGYSGLSILCVNRGAEMSMDQIVGGRVQQDADRQMLTFKVFGTGT